MPGQIRELAKSMTRSSGWRKVRKEQLARQPHCAACFRKATQVHHIKPFHLYPELELEPSNLISFCADHHLLFGHLMYWRSWNPNVEQDAADMKFKISTRPDKHEAFAREVVGSRHLNWFRIKNWVYNIWR